MAGIQGFSPFIFLIPIVTRVMLLDNFLSANSDITITINLITNVLVVFNPFTDAITSLIFIKPFKRAISVWLSGIKHGKLTFQ